HGKRASPSGKGVARRDFKGKGNSLHILPRKEKPQAKTGGAVRPKQGWREHNQNNRDRRRTQLSAPAGGECLLEIQAMGLTLRFIYQTSNKVGRAMEFINYLGQ